jgi:benzoate-CoA ligase
MSEHTPPPPERFNFAHHLIELNAARSAKVALIDDAGATTYGEQASPLWACGAKTVCCC